MFYGPSMLLLTFLFLCVEIELQFLNHISLFAKLLNSLAFCYIMTMIVLCYLCFSVCLIEKKKTSQTAAAFLRSPKVHI